MPEKLGRSSALIVGLQLGSEPEGYPNQVRGYVLPNSYTFTGESIIDSNSGEDLSEVARDDVGHLVTALEEKIMPGTALAVSDYGDVFVPLDDGDPVRLATAHRGIWFPGHLPGDREDVK